MQDEWKRLADSVVVLLAALAPPGGINGWELSYRQRRDKAELHVVFTSGYGYDWLGSQAERRKLEL